MPPNYSVYPIQIDSTNELPITVDLKTYVVAEVANRIRSAVINIETELGAQPSSIYGNVRNRLDFIEAQVIQMAGGWILSSNIVQLASDTFTVDFNNHIIISSGNPTWDFGTGNSTFGGQVDVVGPFRISDANLPTTGDFRLPVDFSAYVYTGGGNGALIACSADGNFYRLDIGSGTRTSYGNISAATSITMNIGALAAFYVDSARTITYQTTFEFANSVASPILTVDKPGVDTAGTALSIRGQKAGNASGLAGQIGGPLRMYGGEGADGTGALAAGAGGSAALYGGVPGANGGGGGAPGGSCYIDPAAGTDVGSTHGQIYIGVTSTAVRKTKQINIGNTTDNPPTTFAGTGLVTLTASPLVFGASPGASGTIRLTDTNNVTWLNGGNTYALVSGQGASAWLGGPYPTRPTNVDVDALNSIGFLVAGNGVMALTASQVQIYVTTVGWLNSAATPTLRQDDLTTVAGTGQTMLIHAQDETGGGASVGGALNIRAGNGTTHGALTLQDADGNPRVVVTATNEAYMNGATYCQMQVASSPVLTAYATYVFSSVPNWIFGATVAAPTIYQSDDVTIGGVRPTFHLQAQSTTVGGGTGGKLSLESGNGPTNGGVQILVGGPAGTTMMEFTPSWISFNSGIGVNFTGNPAVNGGTGVWTMPGDMHLSGGFYRVATLIDSGDTPYTILATDTCIHFDTSGGVITAVLPTVASSVGREIEFEDWTDSCGANPATIAAQIGETVDGLALIAINTNGGGCKLRCDGVVWRVVRHTV